MTTPVERTRALQRKREARAAADRAREQRRARKYLRAFDAAEGGDLFQVREPMARKTAPDVTAETADTKSELPKGRKHRATYARDNRKGGYMIRVTGPYPAEFAGREVPVTTRAGDEHNETLDKLVWSGKDQESGEPVALYTFVSKPRDESDRRDF